MKEIKETIENAKFVVITTHKSPDGDAVGSSMALYHYLKKNDKTVKVVVPDNFPAFLKWMDEEDTILYFDRDKDKGTALVESADLIFSLDYNALNRIGELGDLIEKSSATKVVIDHHQNPQDFADFSYIDTDCCSTSQLVYELIEELGHLNFLDEKIGACIYCGIMTDTGSFRFPSTTAKTHRIIAHLLELGVKGAEIHQRVYDTYSEHRLRLLGYALTEKMKVFQDQSAAYISLTSEELSTYNYIKGDTEGLVNYPLSINGVKMAILITEKDNEVRLSFRSKDDVFVNEIASVHFGGGGHIYAAGGTHKGTIATAIEKVEMIIKENK